MDHLLPQNATAFEIAMSKALDPTPRMKDAITAMRGIKYIATPAAFLPFLAYEYGLGELSPYVPNVIDLIGEGVRWQRVRGTPAAVARALGWIGYSATIEEAKARRRRWHLMQLGLDRVRDVEEPDLTRIEGVTQLSVPVRTHFWRGYSGYDVRPVEWSCKKWGGSRWSSSSGVRIHDGGAKWSFGRVHEIDHEMTQTELTALGLWIDTVPDEVTTTWSHEVWPHSKWTDIGATERRKEIIDGLLAKSAWVTFRRADGTVIGHRKARAWHPVKSGDVSSPYVVGGYHASIDDAVPAAAYLEAMTDFGEGYGSTAAKWQIVLGATLADGVKPGKLWLEPAELVGGTIAREVTQTIAFGRTVRERCKALLRVI